VVDWAGRADGRAGAALCATAAPVAVLANNSAALTAAVILAAARPLGSKREFTMPDPTFLAA
jgi:hypothetical protein